MARAPDWVSECNCSICRRLGTLMSYYHPSEVRVEGRTIPYIWGDRMISNHHCPTCGCTTHWENLLPDQDRMGVNARLFEDLDLDSVERRRIDGASF